MITLTIRTDKPEAEIGLFRDQNKLDYKVWQAHKRLSSTIHVSIRELLDKSNLSLKDIDSLIVFRGPGSFTGLRIGISVANAFAYALNVPIVSAGSETWIEEGLQKLLNNENEEIVLPEYGQEPHITKQTH